MVYLVHGYIDVFNHEIKHDDSKKLKLVTKTNDIVFEQDGKYSYNSKIFVNKIIEKITTDYNDENNAYKNIQLKKSTLKFSPKNQPHCGGHYHEHSLKFKIHPFEDSAHIAFDEFNIVAIFNNEIACIKQDYIKKRKYIFEENQVKLITLPQHCINISLKNCKNYSIFKGIVLDAIYSDVSSLMIDELKKLSIPKWNIALSETELDIEGIVNDNLKILVA